MQRFESLLEYVDIIRIDHFRGFESYWAVKQGEATAIHGEWIKAPGEEFFQVLNDKLGKLPIMAEDLGIITPEVEAPTTVQLLARINQIEVQLQQLSQLVTCSFSCL